MNKTATPCCSKDVGIKKGPWTPEEDEILADFVRKEGEGRWRTLPKRAGLHRCGKSCRLRWMNYLRPSVKRGHIALDEEDLILRLHRLLGNRWALIAGRIPGRTDNEIKNYWNTHISKKLIRQGIDPRTHKPLITNTNTNTTTTTTTTNGFLISSTDSHHIHKSSSNSPIIPTPSQPADHVMMGLTNNHYYHHPPLEIGSSSSSTPTTNNNNNVDEVPIIATTTLTSADADGKLLLEYQNIKAQGVSIHGNDEHADGINNNNEDNTFLLFLNSLVNEEEEVVMSNNSNNNYTTFASSSLPLSTLSCAQPPAASSFSTLADWEAEFSNALNGGGGGGQYYYYGSPPSSSSPS